MLQKIDSDTPFDVVFLNFWEPGDILDKYGSHKILTCLDCMTGFGIGADIGSKEITSDQTARWACGNLFVPFGIPKIIVVGTDGFFYGIFKKTFQETLIIPVHEVARGNHKEIINEGFNMYLNKVQKINSEDKGSLQKWLQGVLFALYAWNADPVDRTDLTQ